MHTTLAQPRCSGLSILLRWLMLVLIALTHASTELRVLFERGTPGRDFLRQARFGCGLQLPHHVVGRDDTTRRMGVGRYGEQAWKSVGGTDLGPAGGITAVTDLREGRDAKP
jgi:cytochrome b561